MKKKLILIVFGLALVFLGHSAKFYQIPLLNTLGAFVYDARLRLTTKGGVDERIVILDIDEKEPGRVAALQPFTDQFRQWSVSGIQEARSILSRQPAGRGLGQGDHVCDEVTRQTRA